MHLCEKVFQLRKYISVLCLIYHQLFRNFETKRSLVLDIWEIHKDYNAHIATQSCVAHYLLHSLLHKLLFFNTCCKQIICFWLYICFTTKCLYYVEVEEWCSFRFSNWQSSYYFLNSLVAPSIYFVFLRALTTHKISAFEKKTP